MSEPAFIVTKFTNRNGVTSWRVDGRLNGLRIRKNFKSREEAGAEKAVLDAKATQTETGVRTTLTRLTEEQLHEAEAAFRRLAASPKSLSFYLDFALANYRAPDREQTLADAVTAYVAFKTREHEQNLLSISQHDHIRSIKRYGRCAIALHLADSPHGPAEVSGEFQVGGLTTERDSQSRAHSCEHAEARARTAADRILAAQFVEHGAAHAHIAAGAHVAGVLRENLLERETACRSEVVARDVRRQVPRDRG